MTDWKAMNHIIPDGYERFVVMLAEAGSADNELKLITRYQKIVRAICETALNDVKLKTKLMKDPYE